MKYGFTEVGTWVGRLVKKGGNAADVSGGTMKKTRMVMIRAPGLPLHTSGHSGKCRCHKKEEPLHLGKTPGSQPTPPPPPHRAEPEEKQNGASSREGRRRDANCFWRKQGYFAGWRTFERAGALG